MERQAGRDHANARAPRPPSDAAIRWSGLAILALGLGACVLAIASEQLGLGADPAEGTFGWKRASLLGVGAIMAAAGGLLLARPQIASRNWDRIQALEEARYWAYLSVGLLALVGLALVWTRLLNLNVSFWHDEVHTVINYSAVGPGPILFGEGEYSINNHALYNFLSWATTTVLGDTSEAMYRLWSVLPAIAAVAIGAWWAWRRLGPVAAIAFAALAVAAPQHMDLGPQARGYGLALLAATVMLVTADRLTRTYANKTLLGFIAAGLVGIWTLHVFAVAFIGQALALMRWPRLRWPTAIALGATALLSALFYAPVLLSIIAESRPRGETISLLDALLLDRSLGWLAVPSLTGIFDPGLPWLLRLVALAVVLFGLVAIWRRGEQALALLLIVPPLFFNVFISLVGLSTVPRHQFLLLTHILMLVAVGIAELARLIPRHPIVRPIAAGIGVLAALAMTYTAIDRESGKLPYENFKEAANVVHYVEAAPAITDTMRPDGFRYYLGRNLIELDPAEVEERLCQDRRQVAYVRHVPLSPLAVDYRSPASLECLEGRDWVRVRVPQRGRGSAIDVWIVNPDQDLDPVRDDIENAPDPWYERAVGSPQLD